MLWSNWHVMTRMGFTHLGGGKTSATKNMNSRFSTTSGNGEVAVNTTDEASQKQEENPKMGDSADQLSM